MTDEFYDTLIDSIYNAFYYNEDYPQSIQNEIKDVINDLINIPDLTPEGASICVTAVISSVERYAFERGFAICLKLIFGSIRRAKDHE